MHLHCTRTEHTQLIAAHSSGVSQLQMVSDAGGQLVVSGGCDGCVRVWDVRRPAAGVAPSTAAVATLGGAGGDGGGSITALLLEQPGGGGGGCGGVGCGTGATPLQVGQQEEGCVWREGGRYIWTMLFTRIVFPPNVFF